jgi:hypothetical protein
MSDYFAIVDQVAEAKSHAERMELLLSYPRWHLAQNEGPLNRILNVAGFREASNYVSAERIALYAVRGPDGADRLEIQIMRAQCILDMRAKSILEGRT